MYFLHDSLLSQVVADVVCLLFIATTDSYNNVNIYHDVIINAVATMLLLDSSLFTLFSSLLIFQSLFVFGRQFVKRFALCYWSVVCPVCLSVLSVCL